MGDEATDSAMEEIFEGDVDVEELLRSDCDVVLRFYGGFDGGLFFIIRVFGRRCCQLGLYLVYGVRSRVPFWRYLRAYVTVEPVLGSAITRKDR